MSNKQKVDSTPTSITLAEENFNELDNWLGIMDLDPPKSSEEKQAMYERLLEILEEMFEPKNDFQPKTINKKIILRDMRKIIER